MYICNITEGKEVKKILERGGRLGAALRIQTIYIMARNISEIS